MQPLGRMMIIIPLRRKMDGNLGMFFAALFIMKGKNRTGLDLFRMATWMEPSMGSDLRETPLRPFSLFLLILSNKDVQEVLGQRMVRR